MKKIAVFCNSPNFDLTQYLSALAKNTKKGNIFYVCNRHSLKRMPSKNIIVGSYTKRSFFDIFIFIDTVVSFFIITRLKIKGIKFIHFTSAHISNISQATFAKLLGIKLAFTVHDLIPHPGKRFYFVKCYNYIIIKCLSDYIVVHNHVYKRKLNQSNVFHIKLSGFKESYIDKTLNKRLLFFGRIEKYKGIENLYKLSEIFRERSMEWKITIAGKGKLPPYKGKFPENIEIINSFIGSSMLEKLHRTSSFVILPYNSASQSGVIIHSYSFATPVIAYQVGCLQEYIVQNQTGICIPHNDFEKIIDFLKNITHEEYENMQEQIKLCFKEKYSEEAFAKNSLKIYRAWSNSAVNNNSKSANH